MCSPAGVKGGYLVVPDDIDPYLKDITHRHIETFFSLVLWCQLSRSSDSISVVATGVVTFVVFLWVLVIRFQISPDPFILPQRVTGTIHLGPLVSTLTELLIMFNVTHSLYS